MASKAAPDRVDHTGSYRGIIAVGSLAVPLFGLVQWGIGYDPFVVRLAFGLVGLALLAGSYVSPTLRRNLRAAPIVFCYALFAWFSYIALRHSMTMTDIVGLLPVVIGVAAVTRRAWELVAFIAFVLVDLLVIYRFITAPAVDISVPLALLTVFAGILGWMSIRRSALEEELQRANATLEERVRERTARLEREVAERLAAERAANAASEAKSRFLANMSHELRTPLNAVIGYSELVDEELATTEQAHVCDDLAKVGRAARHLLTIIDDILDLSRIEVGALPVRRDVVDLRAAIDDAALLVRPAIEAQRDRLTVTLADGLAVRGERGPLVRVLVHLLDNAAKFTTDGTIEVSAERRGDAVEIAVRDSGVGIPEGARASLFDRFTQADESSTRLHGGLGLGLAISKDLVERMGGAITVTSALGEGSVFTLRLSAA